MARYFFHTQTNIRFTDELGQEYPSASLARGEAIRAAGELMRDGADIFWGTRPWSITVTDAAGVVLYEIEMHGQQCGPAANEN
jgi:hypothetical protein